MGSPNHAEESQNPPFPLGETLTYAITWSVFPAGEVVVNLRQVDDGPADDLEARATAKSQGFVSLLFKVNDDFRSVFNPRTHCSSGISKKTNEGRRHKETRIVFNADRGVATLDERDPTHPNEPEKHAENEIPPCVQDVLSALYFLRRQPLSVGHEITIPVNDGSKTTVVVVEVQAREQVQSPSGGRRLAFRVEPKIFGELYKRKGRLFIWISDDEERLPLRMRGESSAGSITGILKSVKPEAEKGSPARSQSAETPSQVK